jgi:hypothetical protein
MFAAAQRAGTIPGTSRFSALSEMGKAEIFRASRTPGSICRRRWPMWMPRDLAIPSLSRGQVVWGVALAIVVLFAVDRAYMDGQNADQLMSLVRRLGGFINREVDDLLRPLRR